MRITDSLFYLNTKNNYQDSMKKLYDVNNQISTGSKIQNSYEDSGIYVDTMRLNHEISTLEQVKETSSKAQTFADNTDATMNQFNDTLTKFKAKLIQSANASNSSTSLEAIANDLTAMRNHLQSIANTSIDGQFLFSGTALDVKPINDDGTYNGNSESLSALIGSGVKLPYNIDGNSLFKGSDSDYSKIVSTNVVKYNQTTLSDSGDKVYLKSDDTIQDLVGGDATTNGTPVFYLSGRKPDGSTFDDKFSISTTSKVSDLLDSIGTSFGNTTTNKVVNVSLNDYGQIEVKDLKKGSSLLDMNIFGAIDRDGGGNANQTDIDDLIAQKNVNIISFDKSNFISTKSASKVGVSASLANPKEFSLNSVLKQIDGTTVKTTDKLQSFMGSNVDHIVMGGTDTAGVAPATPNFAVTAATTVQDLMNAIDTQYSATTRFENGQLYIADGTTNNPSLFNMTLESQDSSNNPINSFATPDSMNYTRQNFLKDGNDFTSNISQIVKSTGKFATASTKLVDASGASSLVGVNLNLSGVNKAGASFDAQINLSNGATGSTFTLDGGVTNYTIFDASGAVTSADDMTYQQLNDVISMITSGVLPADADSPTDGIQLDEYNTAVTTAQNNVEVSLDDKGQIKIHDKTKSKSNIEFSMFDDNADKFNATDKPALSFMANDAVSIQTPQVDFFKELDEMITAVRSGNFHMDSDFSDPRNLGIQNSILKIDHISDHIIKLHTKIGSYSNALDNASQRADLLSLNVKTVRSKIADVDIAEAYMNFTQLSNNYQATLSTIAKINSMSLLNYM
jgi:flagellar hook-associated protein 3 FlgL